MSETLQTKFWNAFLIAFLLNMYDIYCDQNCIEVLYLKAWRKSGDNILSELVMVQFNDAYMRYSLSTFNAYYCFQYGLEEKKKLYYSKWFNE